MSSCGWVKTKSEDFHEVPLKVGRVWSVACIAIATWSVNKDNV